MPRLLEIVKHPSPMVHKKTALVAVDFIETDTLQRLIDDMIATMWQADGIGIAAPQVGHSLRLCIVTDGKRAIPLINPIISGRSLKRRILDEGCLSVPGRYGPVRRSDRLQVRALNRHGQPLTFMVEGMPARIVQHEVDHLDGVLFLDRAKRVYNVEPPAT